MGPTVEINFGQTDPTKVGPLKEERGRTGPRLDLAGPTEASRGISWWIFVGISSWLVLPQHPGGMESHYARVESE